MKALSFERNYGTASVRRQNIKTPNKRIKVIASTFQNVRFFTKNI